MLHQLKPYKRWTCCARRCFYQAEDTFRWFPLQRIFFKIKNNQSTDILDLQKFVLKKHLEALPDALVRLRNATNDLESISSDSAYEGTPELEQANEYLEKAKEVIEKEQTNFPTNGYH